MNALITALVCAALVGHAPQDQGLEARAIARLQQTLVSQLDADLPDRSFVVWLNQVVGPRAGVSWQLTDCGEPTMPAGEAADPNRDLLACVEVIAVLPNERKAVVAVAVGTFKKGLTGTPKLHFAVIENRGELHNVPRLRDLPGLLRAPLLSVRRRRLPIPPALAKQPVLLPATVRALSHSPPSRAPGLVTELEVPPPPVRSREVRISTGVALGEAVVKVLPFYPDAARYNNISGEVQVEVAISEQGRVVEAKATSGHPLLRAAAETAARKWVFKPAVLNGTAIKAQGTLTFIFIRP